MGQHAQMFAESAPWWLPSRRTTLIKYSLKKRVVITAYAIDLRSAIRLLDICVANRIIDLLLGASKTLLVPAV